MLPLGVLTEAYCYAATPTMLKTAEQHSNIKAKCAGVDCAGKLGITRTQVLAGGTWASRCLALLKQQDDHSSRRRLALAP